MAQTTCDASFQTLGPFLSLPPSLSHPVAYFVSNSLYIVVSINEIQKKKKKLNLLMAQTTHECCLGPFSSPPSLLLVLVAWH